MNTQAPVSDEREARAIFGTLVLWPSRRWFVAASVAGLTFLVVAVPTALIATPFFTREIPPTWWSYPVLTVSAVLAGLVTATYVAYPSGAEPAASTSRWGAVGGILTFFAVGCPVCNKIVLLALGASGAMRFFEPVQPILAVASIALLAWALYARVKRERSCRVVMRSTTRTTANE